MPEYNNLGKIWQYPDEFKVKAVMLSPIEGVRVKEVAAALDIHPFMLSRWRKEFGKSAINSPLAQQSPLNYSLPHFY